MIGFSPGQVIDLGNPVSDHPLNLGLVSWFIGLENLSGGRKLFDICPRRVEASLLFSQTTWGPTKNGFQGIKTVGAPTYDQVRCSTFPWWSDVNITVAGFVNISAWNYASSSGCPIFTSREGTSERSPTLMVHNGGGTNYAAFAHDSDSILKGAVGTTAVSLNQWHFLVGTYDGTSAKIYLNAVLEGTNNYNVGGSFFTTTYSGTASIGYEYAWGASSTATFESVSIYNRAISASEVASLYDQALRGYPDTLRRVSSRVWSFGAPAGGATAYTQNLTGTITPAGALTKAVSKGLIGSNTPSATLAKSIAKALAESITPTSVFTKASAKPLTGTNTLTGSNLVNTPAKTLTGTVTPSGVSTDAVSKSLIGTVTPTSTTIVNAPAKALAGTITPSGSTLSESITVGKTGTITPSGVDTHAIAKPLTGTLTPTNTAIVKAVAKPLIGTTTPSGLLNTALAITMTGTATPSGALSNSTSKPLSGTITPSGTLTKATSRVFTATSTFSTALAKAINKILDGGTITPGGDYSSIKAVILPLTGSITPNGADLSKAVAKGLPGTITPSGVNSHAVSKNISGTASLVGVLVKAATHILTGGTLTPSGENVSKGVGKQFSDQLTPTGSVVTPALSKGFIATLTLTATTFGKAIAKIIRGTLTLTGLLDYADPYVGLVGIEDVTGYGPSIDDVTGYGPSITATARGNL